jgi:hypothetical protein
MLFVGLPPLVFAVVGVFDPDAGPLFPMGLLAVLVVVLGFAPGVDPFLAAGVPGFAVPGRCAAVGAVRAGVAGLAAAGFCAGALGFEAAGFGAAGLGAAGFGALGLGAGALFCGPEANTGVVRSSRARIDFCRRLARLLLMSFVARSFRRIAKGDLLKVNSLKIGFTCRNVTEWKIP